MTDENNNVNNEAVEVKPDYKEAEAKGYTAADIEKNKTMAGLAYLLFFLPLIVCPESKFGRYHANQGLLLLIVSVVGSVVFSLVPFVGPILQGLYSIGILVLFVIGLINGIGGKVKPLPIIGGFTLIK